METVYEKYQHNRTQIHQFIKFGIVGGLGVVINTGILYALRSMLGMHLLAASAIATEVAIIGNFIGNHFFTFNERKENHIRKKFISFQIISLITITGTAGLLWGLTTLFGEEQLILFNIIAISIMFIFNYLLNRAYTWKKKDEKLVAT